MKTRRIGNTDINATVIGLGSWAMGGTFWGGRDNREAIKTVQTAIDSGINLIDTAPVYGFGLAEELIGKAIKDFSRDEVIISTKCGLNWSDTKGIFATHESGRDIYHYLGQHFIRQEVENSLNRLKTDYIDIYYTHWPDESTALSNSMETLLQLKKEGKIRAIGASNLSAEQLKDYQQLGGIDVGQEEYSLLNRSIEENLLPLFIENNISMFTYCTIAQGLLTGKILPGHSFKTGDMRANMDSFSEENLKLAQQLNAQLNEIARSYQCSLTQLVIAWTIAQPGITHALCGASKSKQIIENIKAAALNISASDLLQIREMAEQSNLTFKMMS